MSIEQHIEELRAELNATTDREELLRITRELGAARARKRQLDQQLDDALQMLR